MKRVARFWHTVRYLRLGQTLGRIWYSAVLPRPDLRPPPPQRQLLKPYLAPCRRAQSLIGDQSFRFLGQEWELPQQGGWDHEDLGKLWRYNLHYFDDLNSRNSEQRSTWHEVLLERWIRENPPASGTGWEPYPTSQRITNWIKAGSNNRSLSQTMISSLAVQTRWLKMRLETHLLGNHLLANAKALVHAGCFFGGKEGNSWLCTGLRLWAQQVSEQILADGAHFELSPMYHALILEDFLDLTNVLRAYAQPEPLAWSKTIGSMRHWLAAMTHPDGGIAFFNDAAFGVAPSYEELEDYADRLGFGYAPSQTVGCVHLVDSGYVRVSTGDSVAILDCGKIGPDHLPAHAHADSLSFELSLFGSRVFVNSGTSEYGSSNERLRQRGTAAHNTVVVDSTNSSDVWAGFRVARRARPGKVIVRRESDAIIVSCSHDGYRRLADGVRHLRLWRLTPQALSIDDTVNGRFRRAEAIFRLHPSVSIQDDSDGKFALVLGDSRRVVLQFIGAISASCKRTTWHPEFGVQVPCWCVSVLFGSRGLQTEIRW